MIDETTEVEVTADDVEDARLACAVADAEATEDAAAHLIAQKEARQEYESLKARLDRGFSGVTPADISAEITRLTARNDALRDLRDLTLATATAHANAGDREQMQAAVDRAGEREDEIMAARQEVGNLHCRLADIAAGRRGEGS